jgi:hypothetical protein
MALTLDQIGRVRDQFNKTGNSPVSKVLIDFVDDQIKKMKKELAPRRATGSLASSIVPDIVINKNNQLTVSILMNDYWDYINSGVDGVVNKGHAGKNVFGQTYSFKTAFPSRKMIDAFTGTGSLRGWMATQNIKSLSWTNKQGERIDKELITESDFRSAGYVLARAVKLKGIERTPFVDRVFTDESIEKLQEQIFKALDKMLE